MNLSTQFAIATAATVTSIFLGVYAAPQTNALHPPATAIGVAQAIQAAEQHAAGRVVGAEYKAGGTPRVGTHDVEATVDTKGINVLVEVANGMVISSKEGVADRGNKRDRKD